MKFTIAIAAFAAFALAELPEDELDAFDQSVLTKPPGMPNATRRRSDIKVGRVLGRDARDLCAANVKKFNAYCLGKGKQGKGKYGDYRQGGQCNFCTTDGQGLCNGDDRELKQFQQFHCEAQQCAYDYCAWSRDLYIEDCKQAVEEGAEEAPELPAWD